MICERLSLLPHPVSQFLHPSQWVSLRRNKWSHICLLKTTDTYPLTGLVARSPRSVYESLCSKQGLFLVSSPASSVGQTSLVLPACRLSPPLISFSKDRLTRPTLIAYDLVLTNCFCKDLISKSNHIHRYLRVEVQHICLGDTIQLAIVPHGVALRIKWDNVKSLHQCLAKSNTNYKLLVFLNL